MSDVAVKAAFAALSKLDEADAALRMELRRTSDEKRAAAAELEEKFFGVLESAMVAYLDAVSTVGDEAGYIRAERHYYLTGQRIAARFIFADLAAAGKALSRQVEEIIVRARIERYGLKDGA